MLCFLFLGLVDEGEEALKVHSSWTATETGNKVEIEFPQDGVSLDYEIKNPRGMVFGKMDFLQNSKKTFRPWNPPDFEPYLKTRRMLRSLWRQENRVKPKDLAEKSPDNPTPFGIAPKVEESAIKKMQDLLKSIPPPEPTPAHARAEGLKAGIEARPKYLPLTEPVTDSEDDFLSLSGDTSEESMPDLIPEKIFPQDEDPDQDPPLLDLSSNQDCSQQPLSTEEPQQDPEAETEAPISMDEGSCPCPDEQKAEVEYDTSGQQMRAQYMDPISWKTVMAQASIQKLIKNVTLSIPPHKEVIIAAPPSVQGVQYILESDQEDEFDSDFEDNDCVMVRSDPIHHPATADQEPASPVLLKPLKDGKPVPLEPDFLIIHHEKAQDSVEDNKRSPKKVWLKKARANQVRFKLPLSEAAINTSEEQAAAETPQITLTIPEWPKVQDTPTHSPKEENLQGSEDEPIDLTMD